MYMYVYVHVCITCFVMTHLFDISMVCIDILPGLGYTAISHRYISNVYSNYT